MITHTYFTYCSVKGKKPIQLGILEKVTHRGSDWTSLIVAIKKTDGDIRICGDYKIGVNHQICLDLFPLSSIKTACHELANKKHFAKIDLKSANNHFEKDDKFKEITTLDTTMELLRWSCLPFGLETASHIFQRAIEKIWSNCTIVMRPFREARHKLTFERGIIYNEDAIVPPIF